MRLGALAESLGIEPIVAATPLQSLTGNAQYPHWRTLRNTTRLSVILIPELKKKDNKKIYPQYLYAKHVCLHIVALFGETHNILHKIENISS